MQTTHTSTDGPTVSSPEGRTWLRAIGIGILVAIMTAAVMLPLTLTGISPFPAPPSLAFAETIAGRPLPLPVGLLFHTAYVTLWCVIYIRFFPSRTLRTALGLAGALWVVILIVFFPIVGWGFAGLSIGPQLIVASLVPHLLFGVLLWGFDSYLPARVARPGGPIRDKNSQS